MPRSSTPARCVYREGNARCRRNGQGHPALCRAHREVMEYAATAERTPGASFIGVIRDFVAGKRVSNERVVEAAFDGFDVFQKARAAQGAPGGIPRPTGFPGAWPFGGAARPGVPPPRPPPPPPPPPDGARHRATLGFPPGAVLSEEDVNRRRRELAVKFHPDKPGGSVTKMAEINAAADALLELIAAEDE